MDKNLKKQLQLIITGHRPRTLLGPFHGPNGDYYIRNRSLTYWQLREKYPPKSFTRGFPKAVHWMQKNHHLTPHRLQSKIGSYLVWGGLIAFAALWAILHIAAVIYAAGPT